MISETIDLLAARYNDPAFGVNAVLAAMVTEFSWPASVTPFVAIRSETDDLSTALGQSPTVPTGSASTSVFPLLQIAQAEPMPEEEAAKAVQIRDGELPLLVRQLERITDAAGGTRILLRRFRAIKRVTERWLQGAEADRLLDGVYVWYATYMSEVPVWQMVNDTTISGAMLLRLKIRDTAAY